MVDVEDHSCRTLSGMANTTVYFLTSHSIHAALLSKWSFRFAVLQCFFAKQALLLSCCHFARCMLCTPNIVLHCTCDSIIFFFYSLHDNTTPPRVCAWRSPVCTWRRSCGRTGRSPLGTSGYWGTPRPPPPPPPGPPSASRFVLGSSIPLRRDPTNHRFWLAFGNKSRIFCR